MFKVRKNYFFLTKIATSAAVITPKPKAPMASTEAGTARPKTPQANKAKALQAAKAKFDRSGSMTDYQVYLKLKNKT